MAQPPIEPRSVLTNWCTGSWRRAWAGRELVQVRFTLEDGRKVWVVERHSLHRGSNAVVVFVAADERVLRSGFQPR